MPSLANLMEDYRNWRGRQDWEQGKGWQDFFGGDSEMQERAERFGGFGTGSHGVGGLAGMIKASHGSPHMFDKFDFSRIGSGEGAQAYGHGGYFAQGFDSPVAKEYRDQLAADVQLKGQPFYSGKTGKQMATTGNQELDDYLLANLGDVTAARSNLLADLRDVRSNGGDVKDYQKTLADLRNIRGDVESGNTGHLYNVELKWPDAAREAADPLGEHHLLDWDASISKQSKTIKELIKKDQPLLFKNTRYPDTLTAGSYLNAQGITGADVMKGWNPTYRYGKAADEMTGQDYWHLAMRLSENDPSKASAYLKDFGIPGIRYLDQGSRSAGKGSRNYVMFDDQFPEIVSQNGVSLSDLLRR